VQAEGVLTAWTEERASRKLYLPIIAPTINIMASSVCAAPPKRLSMVKTTKGAGV
jgi:hypothetical protein